MRFEINNNKKYIVNANFTIGAGSGGVALMLYIFGVHAFMKKQCYFYYKDIFIFQEQLHFVYTVVTVGYF